MSYDFMDELRKVINADLHQEAANLNQEWENNSPNYLKHIEDIKARGYRVLRNSEGKHRIVGGV